MNHDNIFSKSNIIYYLKKKYIFIRNKKYILNKFSNFLLDSEISNLLTENDLFEFIYECVDINNISFSNKIKGKKTKIINKLIQILSEIINKSYNNCDSIADFTKGAIIRTENAGKKLFLLNNFNHLIFLKLISNKLQRFYNIKQSNKNDIIDDMKNLLQGSLELNQCYILKLDIKDFYENVDYEKKFLSIMIIENLVLY